jgi:hypothetical protein
LYEVTTNNGAGIAVIKSIHENPYVSIFNIDFGIAEYSFFILVHLTITPWMACLSAYFTERSVLTTPFEPDQRSPALERRLPPGETVWAGMTLEHA